jgi:MFS family permease
VTALAKAEQISVQSMGATLRTLEARHLIERRPDPADRRGFALGTNQIAGLAGQFVGLVAGGLLAAIDWRAVFWINVSVGVFGVIESRIAEPMFRPTCSGSGRSPRAASPAWSWPSPGAVSSSC